MHSWQENSKLAPHSQQNVFVTAPYSSGSNGGTLERALPYYQCSPGSNPSVKAICRLSLLLVLSLALRGFFPRSLVFPPPQKPMLSNSNLIWNARTRLNEFLRALVSYYTVFVWVLQFPPTSEGYQVVQERLSMTGAALNAAASDMVTASRGTSNQLAVSTKKFSLSYQDLLNSGMKLAGQAKVTILSWFIMAVLRFGVINLGFWETAHLPLP